MIAIISLPAPLVHPFLELPCQRLSPGYRLSKGEGVCTLLVMHIIISLNQAIILFVGKLEQEAGAIEDRFYAATHDPDQANLRRPSFVYVFQQYLSYTPNPSSDSVNSCYSAREG